MSLLHIAICAVICVQVQARDLSRAGSGSNAFYNDSDVFIINKKINDTNNKIKTFLPDENKSRERKSNDKSASFPEKNCYLPHLPLIHVVKDDVDSVPQHHPEIPFHAKEKDAYAADITPVQKVPPINQPNYVSCLNQPAAVGAINKEENPRLLFNEIRQKSYVGQASRVVDDKGNVTYQWHDENNQLQSMTEFEYTCRISLFFEAFIQYLIFGPFLPAGGGWHCWQYVEKKRPRSIKRLTRTALDVYPLIPESILLNDGGGENLRNHEAGSIEPLYERQEISRESKGGNSSMLDSLITQCPLAMPIIIEPDKEIKDKPPLSTAMEEVVGLSKSQDAEGSDSKVMASLNKTAVVNNTANSHDANASQFNKSCAQCMKVILKKDLPDCDALSNDKGICFDCASFNLRRNLIIRALITTAVDQHQDAASCAVFGSSGLELIQGVLPTTVKTVNDIDIICEDEKTAEMLMSRINDIFQKTVYGKDYKIYNFAVNRRAVGKGLWESDKAPLGGQVTVFRESKAWFSVDVSVRPDWMKIDLSSEKYITLVNINGGDSNLGRVPVLSLYGYAVLDSLVLRTEIDDFKKFKDDKFESKKLIKFLAYTKKTLEKVYQKEAFFRLLKGDPVVDELVTGYNELVNLLMGSRRILLEKIEYWALNTPYSLSSLGSDVDGNRLSRLASNSEINGNRLDANGLQILLAKDFKINEISMDGGDCFYRAVADALNSNGRVKKEFLAAFNKLISGCNIHDADITMPMVREFIHTWLDKATVTINKFPNQFTQLISLPPGKSISDILDNGYIKNPAPMPAPTAYYGWSNLLYTIVLATGLPIMILSPEIAKQGIRKIPHTFKLANSLLAPDLVSYLIINSPELINTPRDNSLFSDLEIFIVHSGADHYHSATPLDAWTKSMARLIEIEAMLAPENVFSLDLIESSPDKPINTLHTDVDLENVSMSQINHTMIDDKESEGFRVVNAVEFCGIDNDMEISLQEERNVSRKKKKKKNKSKSRAEEVVSEATGLSGNNSGNKQIGVAIEDLGGEDQDIRKENGLIEEGIDVDSTLIKKKKKKRKKKNIKNQAEANDFSESCEGAGVSGIETESCAETKDIEDTEEDSFHNALISFLLRQIKSGEEIALEKMSETQKKSLAKKVVGDVIDNLKIPFKTGEFIMDGSYRIALGKCDEECFIRLKLGYYLGNPTAAVIMGALKMNAFNVEKNSLEEQVSVIRYLKEAVKTGSRQALSWLYLFSAMSGSPYSFSSSLQASEILDSNIENEVSEEYQLVPAVTSKVLKDIIINSTIIGEAIAPLALRHMIIKSMSGKNIYESDWQMIDTLFPRSIDLQSMLTPHLLFSGQTDDFLCDSPDTNDNASRVDVDQRLQEAFTTIVNLTYRGYFFLRTDNKEQALEYFLKSSILYTLLFLSNKNIPNLSIAAGLTSIYHTFRLVHEWEQDKLLISSYFVMQWQKFFRVTCDKFKSISQQHALYAMMAEDKIKGDEPDNVLAFLLAYVRVKKANDNPVVSTIEVLSDEIKEQITFFSTENKGADFNHQVLEKAKNTAGKTATGGEEEQAKTAVKFSTVLLKEKIRSSVLDCSKHAIDSYMRPLTIMDVNSISEDITHIAPQINAFSTRVNEWLNVYVESLDNERVNSPLIMEGVDLLESINFILKEKVFFLQEKLKSLDNKEKRTYNTNKARLVYNGLRIISNIHKLKTNDIFNNQFLQQILEFQRYGVNKNSFDYVDDKSSHKMYEFLREFISLVDPKLYSEKNAEVLAKLFTLLSIHKNITLMNVDESNLCAVVNLIDSYLQHAQDIDDVVAILAFLVDTELSNKSLMRLFKKTVNKIILIMIQSVEYDEQQPFRDKIDTLMNGIDIANKAVAVDYWNNLQRLMDEDTAQVLAHQERQANAIYDELMSEENSRVEKERLKVQRLQKELENERLKKCRMYEMESLEKKRAVVEDELPDLVVTEKIENEKEKEKEKEKEIKYVAISKLLKNKNIKEGVKEQKIAEKQSDGDTIFILRLKALVINGLQSHLLKIYPLLNNLDDQIKYAFLYELQYGEARERYNNLEPLQRSQTNIFPSLSRNTLIEAVSDLDNTTADINAESSIFYLLLEEVKSSIDILRLFVGDAESRYQDLEPLKTDLQLMFSHYDYLLTIKNKLLLLSDRLSSACEDLKFLSLEAAEIKKKRLAYENVNSTVTANIKLQSQDAMNRKEAISKLRKIKRRVTIFSQNIPEYSQVEEVKNRVLPKS